MALFSPFSPPGQGRDSLCMVIYERVGEREGAAVKPTSPLCCDGLGWAEVPVIGSVLSYIHAHARSRKPLTHH